MLNRNPPKSSNILRKRRVQRGPFLMYGAIALVVLGVILLLVWLTRPSQPLGALFATDTPTATLTFTPTNTLPPTETPTITPTPTETVTSTPSEPFSYTVQEGDSLFSIAEKNNLGNTGIAFLLILNPSIDQCNPILRVGDQILIPNPGLTIPTATPIPPDLPRGTKVTYLVQAGDTLAGIAGAFSSTVDEILKENGLDNPNLISSGQCLTIPINLVTATATFPATSTPVTPTVAGQPTATTASGAAGTLAPACNYDENASFVTQLQTFINDERTSNNLSALSVNAQLAAAAKSHAIDLLCNNYLSHEGSDGSTPESRVEAQGFTASLVIETLYASPVIVGSPQSAIDWWMSNPASQADILNANTSVFGVAYVASDESMLGGYFVVVSAKP